MTELERLQTRTMPFAAQPGIDPIRNRIHWKRSRAEGRPGAREDGHGYDVESVGGFGGTGLVAGARWARARQGRRERR